MLNTNKKLPWELLVRDYLEDWDGILVDTGGSNILEKGKQKYTITYFDTTPDLLTLSPCSRHLSLQGSGLSNYSTIFNCPNCEGLTTGKITNKDSSPDIIYL